MRIYADTSVLIAWFHPADEFALAVTTWCRERNPEFIWNPLLTNAFSKKLENHEHMIAIYFMHYNFCRIHQTLRVTPAMEAGISDHVWSLDEVVSLLG